MNVLSLSDSALSRSGNSVIVSSTLKLDEF